MLVSSSAFSYELCFDISIISSGETGNMWLLEGDGELFIS